MHRPLCCYGRSALAALLFPVAEIAGVSDLGGVELAVLVLGGDGGAGPAVAPKDENGKFDATKIADASDFGDWEEQGCKG